MALGLTPEHLELAAAVRGWAGRHVGAAVIRAAMDADDAGMAIYLSTLAPALADQGLLGLHLTEADGGQGFGLPELAVATEELGRALLPGAFLPTVHASAVLALAGGPPALLLAGWPTGRLPVLSAWPVAWRRSADSGSPMADWSLPAPSSRCWLDRVPGWSSRLCGWLTANSGSPVTPLTWS